MKRWVLYIALFLGVAIFGAIPFRGTDIAELAPVEVVWLSQSGGRVHLETDTGDMGEGENVQAALNDMKAAAPGAVFLDTADFLIVEQGGEELLTQVYDVLRPTCMVCISKKMPDMEAAAEFLAAHEPELSLRQYRVEKGTLPELIEKEGRFMWNAE